MIKDSKEDFLFFDPTDVLGESDKSWLSQCGVAHIAPIWLEIHRDTRKYGGIEDVMFGIVNNLSRFGVLEQRLFGHPDNRILEARLPALTTYSPSFREYRTEDLFGILQSDSTKARELELQYVLFAYQKLASELERGVRVGIVHDHTNIGRDLGYFFAQNNLPIVRTEHGPLLHPYQQEHEEAHLGLFEGAKNMHFVAISNSQKSEMPQLPWIGVVHNGVDLGDFEYSEEKRGHKSLGQYLLAMGRISRVKGFDVAIKIARELAMPLILAGHVEDTKDSHRYFEEEIRPHLSSTIRHIPGVGTEARKELLRDAACFLMPVSWPEPFGMVTIEAMSSGTPVVGYKRGALPEIIVNGETGFLVDDFDSAVDATADILRGVYNPRSCRARVEEHFSDVVMAAKYAKIYREVALKGDV